MYTFYTFRVKLPSSLATGLLLVVLVGTGGAAAALEPARVGAGTPAGLLGAPVLVPQLPPPALGPAVPAAARPREDADALRASLTERTSANAGSARPAPEPPPQARPATGLDTAVARLPGYRPGAARWVHRSFRGRLGAADWYTGTIYVSPRTPSARLYSVVAHEWSHLLQAKAYDGDVRAAVRAMNRHFGGSGFVGAERAADCMALLQGATWTHYTSCPSRSWRSGAALLLQGRRL